MYEAAVPLEMRDTSPVGTGDKKKRRGAHEALCRVPPRHVSTQEDGGLASGGKVKGVEGRDQGLSKFFGKRVSGGRGERDRSKDGEVRAFHLGDLWRILP